MAVSRKKAESTAFSAEEISQLRALVRRLIEGPTGREGLPITVDVPRFTYPWGSNGPAYQLMEPPQPLGTALTPEEYLEVVDSRGKIVNISVKKIEERLTQIVQSIGKVAEGAARAGEEIAKKASKVPFDLDEITVGLSINVEAGVVVFGFGGDVNLELKFVRTKGTKGSPSS